METANIGGRRGLVRRAPSERSSEQLHRCFELGGEQAVGLVAMGLSPVERRFELDDRCGRDAKSESGHRL